MDDSLGKKDNEAENILEETEIASEPNLKSPSPIRIESPSGATTGIQNKASDQPEKPNNLIEISKIREKLNSVTDRNKTGSEKEKTTGTYSKVALKKGGVLTLMKNEGITGKLFSFIKKGGSQNDTQTLASITNSVLNEHLVAEKDLALLPQGLSYNDQIRLANLLASITSSYNQGKFNQERSLQKQLPRETGLILSDFLQVIPRDLAARILYAASNPDTARTISKGEGTFEFRNADDVMQSAVEAMVLLPQEIRLELFQKMAKIHPGTEGRAYKFFAFLASNWGNRLSEFSGQKFIELNLPETQANNKITEVAGDLSELGKMLRSRAA